MPKWQRLCASFLSIIMYMGCYLLTLTGKDAQPINSRFILAIYPATWQTPFCLRPVTSSAQAHVEGGSTATTTGFIHPISTSPLRAHSTLGVDSNNF